MKKIVCLIVLFGVINVGLADQANNLTVANNAIIKEELPLSPQDLAISAYNQGVELLVQGQDVDATIYFKRAISNNPKHHKARMQLVQLFQKIGWQDEIEKLLQAGLDLAPEHSDFIKNLALLYSQKGQMRKALSVLLTMPENNTYQTDYLALLALTYLNSEQADMAIKYYQQLLAINKDNPNWWLGLGIAQYTNGNYQKAIDSFNQAKTLGRFNTDTLDYINNKIEQIKQK